MVKRALRLVGLDKIGVVVDQVELKSEDHFLPFGPKRDTILRIHVRNFKVVEKERGKLFANPYIHSLNLFYSEDIGQVVKIVSDLPRGVKVEKFPPALEQEKALKAQGQRYVWSPLPSPRVKLGKALESAMRVSDAKQILVYYTRSWGSFYGKQMVPVWEIYMRGLPATPDMGNAPPGPTEKELKEQLADEDDWVVPINATTGEGIGFSTSLF